MKNEKDKLMLKTTPAVFAVGDEYQIFVPLKKEAMMWVKVADKEYYDASNGIMRSQSKLHRVSVPMAELNSAGRYTVYIRPIIKRLPYFTQTAEVRECSFDFYPVPENNIRCYHISDAHNDIDGPVAAANAFGDIDLLILNGDVIDHSGNPRKFDNVYKICEKLTGGNKPVVFSRGNHDMRGNYAERFAEYTPNGNGNTYYTFRLGSLWGLVLDCGEDKTDDHAEYGYTVACHDFRQRQTRFIEKVADSGEAFADGIKTRVIIAHNPFIMRYEDPFDIENDIFNYWTKLIGEKIKPDVYICGHCHVLAVGMPGDECDARGVSCPVIIGARPDKKNGKYEACGITFGDEITVEFTDNKGGQIKKVQLFNE